MPATGPRTARWVTAKSVLGLGDLSASNAVPGASGVFGFDPVADNPTGRDFPVL